MFSRVNHTRHYAPLDGLRGLAIVLVFLCHYGGGRHFHSPISRIYGDVVVGGWSGVDLFFALSGFLITGILLDTRGDSSYFGRFYGRRALRIFPVYYLVLSGIVIYSLIEGVHWHPIQYSYFLYLDNVWAAFHFRGLDSVGTLALAAFWSLAVEEQFYLVWPALIRFCRTRFRLKWLFALSITVPLILRIALVLWTHQRAYDLCYYLTICRMDELAMGGLLALLVRRTNVLEASPWIPRSAVLLGGAAIFAIGIHSGTFLWQSPLMSAVGFSILGVSSTALIWLSLRPGSLASAAFSLKPLRFLGKYSYGIYIFHFVPFNFFKFRMLPFIQHTVHNKLLGEGLAELAVAAIVISAAYSSYNLYERPLLKLKKYLRYDDERESAMANR